jgi:multidrug transporter EmrE-like cation transporter
VLLYALFALGATLQSLGMRQRELGTTYVLVLGLEAVLACSLAVLAFGEAVTPQRIVAVGLVLVGVYLLH